MPEIWSDGEDNEGQPTRRYSHRFVIPKWAEWDELEKAMQLQSQKNPEDIFGPLPVLDMSEIFPDRERELRQRERSARQEGPNQVTSQDPTRYNEEMGRSGRD